MYFQPSALLLIKCRCRFLCATLWALMAVVRVNKWFHQPWERVTHYAWHCGAGELCVETHKTPPGPVKILRATVARLTGAEPSVSCCTVRPWGSADLSSAHFSRTADLRWVMPSQIRRSATLYLRIKWCFQVVWVCDGFKLGRRC